MTYNTDHVILTLAGTPARRKTDKARVGSTCLTSSPSSSEHSNYTTIIK